MPSTSKEWEPELGKQIRTLRLRQDLDQKQMAERAGIALNAVKNLESGKGATLRSLIQVLRILNRTDWLGTLAPTVSISPDRFEFRALQHHELEVGDLAQTRVEQLPDRPHVPLRRFSRQPQDQIGIGAQPAAAHMNLQLFVGFDLDGLPLDVAQHVLIQRLHGLVKHQRAAHLLDRLDDPVRTILAGGGVDISGQP